MKRYSCALLAALAVSLAALTPVRAADAQISSTKESVTYLPNDSQFIVRVNFAQLRDASLVKKYVLKQIQEGLKKDEAQKILNALGFDPLKDLTSLTVAGPVTSDVEKLVFVAHGNFDVDKFQKQAEQVASNMGDVLKISKEGGYKIWEVSPPNVPANLPPTSYVCLIDKSTMVFTWGKATLKDALAKAAKKKTTELTKEMAGLVAKADNKQSLYAMVLVKALTDADFIPNIEAAKPFLQDKKSLSFALVVKDEIAFHVSVGAKDAAAAKKIESQAKTGLVTAPGLLGIAAMQNQQVAPFVEPITDLIKTMRVKTQGTVVTVSGLVSKDLIEKFEKAAKMAQAGQ